MGGRKKVSGGDDGKSTKKDKMKKIFFFREAIGWLGWNSVCV